MAYAEWLYLPRGQDLANKLHKIRRIQRNIRKGAVMKKVFVKTKNVKQLISMMNRLREREDGVPGMGLFMANLGLVKLTQ